jgi:HEAT repeat protein
MKRLKPHACSANVLLCAFLTVNLAHAQFWPTAQARIEQTLQTGSLEERRHAAQELHRLPASVCRRLALRALDDPDPQVRQSAGQLALVRRYVEVVPRINVWLSDTESNIRKLAAQLLGLAVVGDEQVALLARLLSDPIADVRRTAASVLARAESTSATQALLNHLGDGNDGVRLAVISSLGELESPLATLPLLAKLQDPSAAVRRAAVVALGEIRDAGPATALNLAIVDGDADVRYVAVEAVAKRGNFDAVEVLRERVSVDRDVLVRVAALRALAALGVQQNCPVETRERIASTIVDSLAHAKQELRDEALVILREFSPLGQPQLQACLSDVSAAPLRTPFVLGCALALAASDKQRTDSARQTPEAGPSRGYELSLSAWRRGLLADGEWLKVIASGGYQQSLPIVLDLLHNSSSQLRLQALDAAYSLLDPTQGDGRAVEPLGTFLSEASSLEEIASAIALLGHTGSKRAVAHLVPFGQENAPLTLRIAAFRALGEIKGANVSASLVTSALTADSSELRSAVARSIREGEWAGLGATLVNLLRDATYDEVMGVAIALAGITPTFDDPKLVATLAREVEVALPVHQDALIEAFGRIPWRLASQHWKSWVKVFECAPLAKLAEALGGQLEARPLLAALLDSHCEQVVSNALWSLRYFPLDEALLSRVRDMTRSAPSRLAGNAVAALAEVRTASTKPAIASSMVVNALCDGIIKGRWAAPALSNALTGLLLRGQRCSGGGAAERELIYHPVNHVRKRAARLLLSVTEPDGLSGIADRQALRQCARTDLDGDVAATCVGEAPSEPSRGERWVTITVVPEPGQHELPSLPFALQRAEGWIRTGHTDRGGALSEKLHSPADVSLLRL